MLASFADSELGMIQQSVIVINFISISLNLYAGLLVNDVTQ